MTETLALAHGVNVHRDRKRMVTLSDAAVAGAGTFTVWTNAGRSLRGVSGRNWETGRLPAEHVPSFRASDFAIYSYATPIAWRTNGVWIVPDEHYSVTTSRHQSLARQLTAGDDLDGATG